MVDNTICARCPNGAMRANGRGSAVDRIAAACGRACTVRLEEAGKCSNRFAQPFRKRAPWAVDLFQRPLADAPATAANAAANAADSGCGRNLDTIGQGR